MRVVVKIGGSLLKEGLSSSVGEDVARVAASSEVVLVHGGGDVVTGVADRLGKKQRFIISPEGVRSRYTDRETADIYTMVMSGMVAKRIVLALHHMGVKAVSLSGVDGGLLTGMRKKRLAVIDERGRKVIVEGGYTGRVQSVNAQLLRTLTSSGYVPIVSPVAVGDESEPLNIDGDRAASSVAAGTGADVVVFLTNVDGLIIDGKVVPSLSAPDVEGLLPCIGFGMQKKVMAAAEAVRGGVGRAVICSGTVDSPITKALAGGGGTVVR